MRLYLVRHAKAGDPDKWEGDDHLRPLTKRGARQAARLVPRFDDVPVSCIVSSPYVRCIETVEPIAVAHGLKVETDPVLAERRSFVDAIELLDKLPDHAVACSHGDVIPEVIAALYRRGMEIDGVEDWRKGVTWVLERRDGLFVSSHTWPPPPDE